MEQTTPGPRSTRVCVLAPMPLLTITIEAAARARLAADTGADDADDSQSTAQPEIHVHPGGQGLWLARMAHALGTDVVVCGPFGGENGTVVAHLARTEGLAVRATAGAGTSAYVHDRRNGEREEVASMPPAPLDRHELDDLYGTVLTEALESDVCILTGADPEAAFPASFHKRLAADLRSAGRTVVADLSGESAAAVAAVEGTVLKISHSELIEGGYASGDSLDEIRDGARALRGSAARAVVVSRAADPTLLVTADGVVEVEAPQVSTADHRGAGDSMTAGIGVGLGRGQDLVDAVRLGVAAGALNATRHGLGTGRRDEIERFAAHVGVRDLA